MDSKTKLNCLKVFDDTTGPDAKFFNSDDRTIVLAPKKGLVEIKYFEKQPDDTDKFIKTETFHLNVCLELLQDGYLIDVNRTKGHTTYESVILSTKGKDYINSQKNIFTQFWFWLLQQDIKYYITTIISVAALVFAIF